MQYFKRVFVVSCCVITLMACQSEPKMEGTEGKYSNDEALETHADGQEQIIVPLMNEEDIEIGVATLDQTEEGVQITVEGRHLPSGVHGFHIHDKGVCEAPTFETAGGHFNPDDKKHGFDHPDGPHRGDIQNLEVGEDGRVEATFVNQRVTLKKDEEHSLYSKDGTALVIHEKPDDYYTQPAGDAGERIACGVIVPLKEASKK